MNTTLPSAFDVAAAYSKAAILRTYGETVQVIVEGLTHTQKAIYQCPAQTTDAMGQKVTLSNRSIQFDEDFFRSAAVQAGDKVIHRGIVYTLLNPAADGDGWIICNLREFVE